MDEWRELEPAWRAAFELAWEALCNSTGAAYTLEHAGLPGCGEENPPHFRLCGYCGTPLAPAAPPQEVRKVVTILFCDLKGSTGLGERLDSESLREAMPRYFDAMAPPRAARRDDREVHRRCGHGGVRNPALHEDDALRAVRAADRDAGGARRLNRRAGADYGVRLANRTGVNTGEVVAGDVDAGQRLVTGDPVNIAARLEQAAAAVRGAARGPHLPPCPGARSRSSRSSRSS